MKVRQNSRLSPFFLLLALLSAAVAGCEAPPQSTAGSRPAQDEGQEQVAPDVVLANTVVTPYLNRRIEPGKNLMWCATFQMTWDSLKELSGGLVKTSPGSITVSKLNHESIGADSIPTAGVVSAAGLVRDGVIEDTQARMRKLPGSPRPTLLPARGSLPEDAVILYAYLARSLRFSKQFALLPAMSFGDSSAKVACVGLKNYSPSSEAKRAQASQIRVLWHRFLPKTATGWREEEFVLELVTLERQDRLLLARIAPAATLRETIDRVMKLVERPNSKTVRDGFPPELEQLDKSLSADALDEKALEKWRAAISSYSCLLGGEDVRIPKIKVEVTRSFEGLIGQTVVSGNEAVRNKPIFDACQRIRFSFDEKGADLESEAFTGLFGDFAMRTFSFSEPFLVLLMRREADTPYFALWVANAELLVRAE